MSSNAGEKDSSLDRSTNHRSTNHRNDNHLNTTQSKSMSNIGVYRFILRCFCKFKTLIVVHLLSILGYSAGVTILPVFISKMAVTHSIAWVFVEILLLNIAISISIRFYHYFVWVYFIPLLQKQLSDYIMVSILNRGYAFYQTNLSGDLSKKRTDLINELPNVYISVIDGFFCSLLFIVFSAVGMQTLPMKYCIYLMSWCLSFCILSLVVAKRLVRLSEQAAESDTQLNGLSTDVMSNMLSVKLFNRESFEEERFAISNVSNMKVKMVLEKLYYHIFNFYSFGFLLMLAYGCYNMYVDYYVQLIDIGGIILFLQLSIGLVSRLWMFTQQMQQYLTGMGKIKQAYNKIFSYEIDSNMSDLPYININKGEISFNQVKFGYNNGDILFDDLNVVIKGGEKVGLLGYSGAGKTTFVNLILHLYRLQSGSIKIDGQDVSAVSPDSLYHNVSIITQDSFLFHRSVFENIAYGKIGATQEEVIQAAKMAQAHDFIMELEEGYSTNVGEKGSKLSGGQRQRVMIARSILKNAKIMILDEVTSQLDSENEFKIQKNLMSVVADKTAIVIAHRLSTLQAMDRLLIFDHGRIVGDGSHAKLYNDNELYRSLWQKQTGSVE